MRNHRHTRNNSEQINFWQSYSDMMAALLLMFILIMTAILLNSFTQYEKGIKQQEEIDNIIGIKQEIIAELTEAFKDSDLGVTVDEKTGAITFDSSILFDKGESTLKPEGEEFLKAFFPKYIEVILDDSNKDNISEIIIEGHTDSDAGYMYNLDLSQKRAYTVAEYCLRDGQTVVSEKERDELREKMTANGKSYSNLIYDKYGNEDKDASRRVEIKFRLKEEQLTETLKNEIED